MSSRSFGSTFMTATALLLTLFTSPAWSATVYEDGSWGVWERWQVMRERGTTTLTPWFDIELNSNVLAMFTEDLTQGDTLQIGGFNALDGWNNTTQKNLSLKLKSQSNFIINVRILTSNGHRYIRYTNSDIRMSNGTTIDVGLGSEFADGKWKNINRNLQHDLITQEPNNTVLAVNGLLIRGSLFIDDLSLSDSLVDQHVSDLENYNQTVHLGTASAPPRGNLASDANLPSPQYNLFHISTQPKHGEARVNSTTGEWTYFPTVQAWSGDDQFSITANGPDADPVVHIVKVSIAASARNISTTNTSVISAANPQTEPTQNAVVDDTLRDIINDRNTRFVDVKNGSNKYDGTQEQPWQTLEYAFSQLSSGETLLVREGIYVEQNLTLETSGTPSSVTTLRNYPGESVTIDASDSRFKENGGVIWELYDRNSRTYRTKKSIYENHVYTGYATSHSGIAIPLIPYISDSSAGARGINDLTSEEYEVSKKARYVGPGLVTKSGRVYIRLSAVPEKSLNATSSIDGFSTHPDDYELTISNSSRVLSLEGNYINIDGIHFTGAESGIKLKSGSSHIGIKNSIFRTPSTAVLLQDEVHSVNIDSIVVEGNFPDWLAWTDMKGNDGQSTPASYWPMRSAGVNGSFVENITITNSTFNRVFDGFVLSGKNIDISNNKGEFIDDFVQLGSDSYSVFIYKNRTVGAGPSHYGRGNSKEPGTIYIHDNVFDTRQKHLIGKSDPDGILQEKHTGRKSKKPFSSHATSELKKGNPWKIYQNTIIFDGSQTSGSGLSLWAGTNRTTEPHEVYNNVVVETGGGAILSRINLSEDLQYYDGNIYWQTKSDNNDAIFSSWFYNDSKKYNYYSIEEFKDSSVFRNSKKSYSPGWENSGYSGNPLLNSNFSPIQGGIASSGSVKIPSTFHGEPNQYRGALQPE